MSEDKEALRKEFDKHVDLCKSAATLSLANKRIEEAFDWFCTKLKNQAEELNHDGRYSDLTNQIDQLKAELSRKEEQLKAANNIIQLVSPLPPTENVFKALENYRTSLIIETNGD